MLPVPSSVTRLPLIERTGKPLSLPATQPVPVYPVTLDGDRVLVDVDVTI